MHKISIVTISYNQQDFLRECIDSVLSQNYLNLEYIVVDPGSSDKSREIISSYGSAVIPIFESDQGPADGLNNGFKRASGDIFGFINSDDRLESGSLELINNFFSKAPDTDVLCGNAYIIDNNSQVRRVFYSDRFSLRLAAMGASIIAQQATFFRASAFHSAGGFNVANRIAWDGELYIDMALNGAKFSRTKEVLASFRLHPDAITGSGKHMNLRKEYDSYIYSKVFGKPYTKNKKFISLVGKMYRKILNPRDTIERITKGPIFVSQD